MNVLGNPQRDRKRLEYLLRHVCVLSHSTVSDSAAPWTDPRLLCPWDFPGKITGVSCHFFLQRIFLTQRSNPGLLHCTQILYWLNYDGSSMLLLSSSKRKTSHYSRITMYGSQHNQHHLGPLDFLLSFNWPYPGLYCELNHFSVIKAL